MNKENIIFILNEMQAKRCTPEVITSLKPNEVFVFGTNSEGKHKSMVAKLAVEKFGAKMGQGEGFSGQSYAIPVHKHRRNLMVDVVSRFIEYAKANPDKKFYVLAVGCGTAGMDPSFVALMFRQAIFIENICLPRIFIEELIDYYEIGVEISEDCMTVVRFPMNWQGKYTVPYGVECLGEDSFMGCSCELELPQSLKRIGKYAFCDMGSFDYYLKIPSSVSSIDDKAFECEWVSPGMLVDYQSYAYYFAKKHNQRYKCVDFDEEKYIKDQKEKAEQINKESHGFYGFISRNEQFIKTGRVVPKGQIAIARDFALVLNDDGHLTLLGHNEDFQQLRSRDRIIKVAAAFSGYMGLTESGRLVTCGPAREFERSYEIERWRNVIEVVAGEGHTVAIFDDGRVDCIDEPGGWEGVPDFRSMVKEWRNIKQVAVGYENIIALSNDGHVFGYGYCSDYSKYYGDYSDFIQVDAYGHYYGDTYSMALRRNGTVMSQNFEEVSAWHDIVQIAVGWDAAVGLRRDGGVNIVFYDYDVVKEVSSWTNIVNVECKFSQIIAISREGRVYSIKIH